MKPTPPRIATLATLAAALLLICAWAPPAAAEPPPFEIFEIVPSIPTWQDEVKILIQGNFFAATEVTGTRVSGHVVTVDLELKANISPLPPPGWVVTAEAGRLPPGSYQVLVDTGSPDSPFEAGEFTVFGRAPIAIEPAAEPYLDDRPVLFDLLLFDNGVDLDVAPRPSLGIIEVFLDRNSDFVTIPPGPGALRETVNAGVLPAGDYEIRVIDVTNEFGVFSAVTRDITVHDSDGCVPSATALCLGNGRFRVEAAWRDFRDRRGDGTPVPLDGREDTGSFWFFNEDNLELTVKVLDGCGVNGHHWVFISSGSTVEYDVTVTDAGAGEPAVRRYHNDLGQTPALIPDTAAFANCP